MVQLKCFGDSRDLFKYDLITELAKGLRLTPASAASMANCR
jgi:hypothetical protein